MPNAFPRLILALALAAPLPAFAVEKSPESAIYGVWIRDGRQERLEFFDCGGKLCARSVKDRDGIAAGTLILRYAAKAGPGRWKGALFNPQDGQTYSATVALESPTELALTGCLMVILCRSETWRKAAE